MRNIWFLLCMMVGGYSGVSVAENMPEVNIKTELASPIVLASQESHPNFLLVSLQGFDLPEMPKRAPLNLVLVVDRSGSMHGDRIEKAREAAIMAVNILNDNDILSLVAYDSDVEVIIPATKVTDKKAMIQEISRKLQPRGMTALYAGLSMGIEEVTKHLDLHKVNRIILLSDGQANVGPTTVSELVELTKLATKKNISVSTLGIGHDYNESLMVAIANYSDGNHSYIAKIQDLEQAMDKEFRDSMSVVAQNFIITVELPKGVKPIRLLGREGEINGNQITVNMNQIYANQEKYILLEIETMPGKEGEEKIVANVHTQYLDIFSQKQKEKEEDISIHFTADEDMASRSLNEDIYVKAVTQEVVLRQKEALEYMEQGNYDSARKSLRKATLSDAGSRVGLKGSEDLSGNSAMSFQWGGVRRNK